MEGTHEHMTKQVLNHPDHEDACKCIKHFTEEDLANRNLVTETLNENEFETYAEVLSGLSDDEYEDFILNEIRV